MYLAAVVLLDAIPTGWVSKHSSVGLILLQCRYSEAVAAPRRSIPKFSSFYFAVIENPQKYLAAEKPVGMASKSTTAAKYVYAPLVMVSLGAW
jgi:hypothetical protein